MLMGLRLLSPIDLLGLGVPSTIVLGLMNNGLFSLYIIIIIITHEDGVCVCVLHDASRLRPVPRPKLYTPNTPKTKVNYTYPGTNSAHPYVYEDSPYHHCCHAHYNDEDYYRHGDIPYHRFNDTVVCRFVS